MAAIPGPSCARLDDGANAKDGKPGNMHKYLGKDDAQRATNLALFKRWVGGWNLKRATKSARRKRRPSSLHVADAIQAGGPKGVARLLGKWG